KWNRAIVAPLRVPAGIEAEYEMHDVTCLNQHHDRSEQRRHDDFEGHRQNEPRRAASAAPGRALDQGKRQTEYLWQQENRNGQSKKFERSLHIEPRESWKQGELAREIFRPDVACLEDEHDTDDELRQP